MKTSHATKNDKVFEIVNNVLHRTVGDQATRLIYENLEQRHSIKPCDISGNLDVFTDCLKDILKDAALPIENLILNDILKICGFDNDITFELAVPEEHDADAHNVATSRL